MRTKSPVAATKMMGVGFLLCTVGFLAGYLSRYLDPAYRSAVIINAGFEQQQQLHFVDRVEIFALAEGKPGDPVTDLGEFPLHPYGSNVPILSKKTLEGTEAEQLGKMFLRLELIPVEYSALCHLPPYGIRFFKEEELVFETSVCWLCSNFQIPFRGDHTWCGFGSKGPVADALLERLQYYIPLPEWAQTLDSKVNDSVLRDLQLPPQSK